MKLIKPITYYNEDVVYRFMNIYNVEKEEADSILEETIKFLSLSSLDFNFFIDDSMLIIDEMWHNFILFTNDYGKFCFENFGRYIHHQPTTKKEKEEQQINKNQKLEEYKIRTKKQYEIIYDNFGEETLNKWFVYFADKYSAEYIKQCFVRN